MIAWSDVGKHGVAAIFKRATGIKLCPVSLFQFNRQMARCLIHWWRCYEQCMFINTVYRA